MERSGSAVRAEVRLRRPSEAVYCFLSFDRSPSARASCSRNSMIRRSCAAMATMISFGSEWRSSVGVSSGVGGTDEFGVGREGKLLGKATGKVMDSRFVFRDAEDVDRDDRVPHVSLGGAGDGGTLLSHCSPYMDLRSSMSSYLDQNPDETAVEDGDGGIRGVVGTGMLLVFPGCACSGSLQ